MARITVFFVFDDRQKAARFDQLLNEARWETDKDVTSPRHVEIRLDASNSEELPDTLAHLANDIKQIMKIL
jgi:hypothetical protein